MATPEQQYNSSELTHQLRIRYLPCYDYAPIWQQMRLFTQLRGDDELDELWFVEHLPVFTLGQQGKRQHLLNPGSFPVIQSDRGGQVTYHGPGQLVAYPLVNLRRKKLNVRPWVSALEKILINVLADYHIHALARADAPGVYVHMDDSIGSQAKIASLGIRIRRGCCYHGIALNVAMDLQPFQRINPCGVAGLAMTQIKDLVADPPSIAEVQSKFITHFCQTLGYNATVVIPAFTELATTLWTKKNKFSP